jgi:outer membrane immunogenic protein
MSLYRFLKFTFVAAALVSTPVVAHAADTAPAPAYRAAPPIPVFYDWTGFYVGAHIGFGSDGDTGFLGGGQAGFNYQVGQWVLGVEGQISATSIKDSVSGTFVVSSPGSLPVVGTAGAEASIDWISTLAVRAGWAFDRWLVYGKVGGAWAHVSVDAFANMGGLSASVSADKTFSGWMLGLGTEYALWNNWTAKFEYNMMDFGHDFLNDDKVHVFKAGVNYRFGVGPAPRGRY